MFMCSQMNYPRTKNTQISRIFVENEKRADAVTSNLENETEFRLLFYV